MGLSMKEVPYLVEDRDRHGNVRRYVQKPRCTKIRIHEEPGTEAFFLAYGAALPLSVPRAKKDAEGAPGTLRWLCQHYMASCADYKKLEPSTRHVRKLILDKLCQTKDGKGRSHGSKIASECRPHHIETIRDENADRPEAANAIVKALRQVFKWAKKKPEIDGFRHGITSSPAAEVEYLDPLNPDGFYTWADADVEQYEARHPIGTKPRLALALLLYLGNRRSDAVRVGPQMVRNGIVRFVEFKGRKKIRKERELPLLPALADIIAATPCGHLAYLVTEFGKPFSAAGFGNKFREWCDQAGLKHCSAHGLRKAAATRAAENGATVYQLMAIFGWTSIKTAEIYTRKANEKKLAASGMHFIAGKSPTLAVVESPTFKKADKSGG